MNSGTEQTVGLDEQWRTEQTVGLDEQCGTEQTVGLDEQWDSRQWGWMNSGTAQTSNSSSWVMSRVVVCWMQEKQTPQESLKNEANKPTMAMH